ncbi:hypothetical protein WOLCODRAFT_135078 [Wolfiporia cocos MD-104 SS10]|uniref:Actin cortical patch SUR7/pH-response regulator PalI n=1 Tax=Wolfiporia cocos (strain MD-104) TaxID=742152 RepID=A0A2H3ITQ0_WOLCO|nr:hypothetical protein WOLCODRAFT_135078 [Wolfiporia cocos MD-104 SS10]
MRLRGEACIGAASVLSLAALLCLIFMHVGQINPYSVPRDVSMVKVNMSGYGQGLYEALDVPIEGLYTNDSGAPLQQQAGLRQFYRFGLYSYCAYIDDTHGTCSNISAANRFEPFTVITADMLSNYSSYTDSILESITFTDSSYLGEFSNGAYYLLIIGTVCAALALFIGICKHPIAFLLSTLFSIIGSVTLLIGATIWTVIIKKTESINEVVIEASSNPVPLGITVTIGDGLYLAWAAFALLIASILPYMISCCTYRG